MQNAFILKKQSRKLFAVSLCSLRSGHFSSNLKLGRRNAVRCNASSTSHTPSRQWISINFVLAGNAYIIPLSSCTRVYIKLIGVKIPEAISRSVFAHYDWKMYCNKYAPHDVEREREREWPAHKQRRLIRRNMNCMCEVNCGGKTGILNAHRFR